MKKFMDENFLLETVIAQELFHKYAKKMPIFDYHSHLSAKEIYEDRVFKNISEAWFEGDHYKWRALRSRGISEEYITGNKSSEEKFEKWAEILPYTIGNPLFHWTHLELKRYFGIEEILNKKTGKKIYNQCNQMLSTKEFSVRNLLRKMNIHALCTTDDPIDDLKYHKALNEEKFEIKVMPTYRPDNAINIEKETFLDYIAKLSEVTEGSINNLDDLINALIKRINYFHENGGRISDHGLDEVLYEEATRDEVSEIFKQRMKKNNLTEIQISKYKGYIQKCLGKEYFKLEWVMQLHMGALRDNSSRRLKKLGNNTGFDSIDDKPIAKQLSKLLNSLDETNELPKTILYCLNPSHNEVLGTMIGNFQDEQTPGKIQFGSGWWFNDQIDGMKRQIEAFAQLGLISNFVGMLTDSRSFLSFPRHEYFRRILCNYFGDLIEKGLFPNEIDFVGKLVEDISYNNIRRYIGN